MAYFTSADGLQLFYSDMGTGPAVLCLAGLTRNSGDFRFILPFLAGVRVICMDYRGRGRSDHAPDPRSYSVAQEAADAIALLDHLGIAEATILGTSRGGLIAMLLAASAPKRVRGIILNDIGPEIAPGGLERIMEFLGRPPLFATYDEAADALLAQNAAQFPGVTRDRWRIHAELIWGLPDASGGPLTLRYDPALREAMRGEAGAGPLPDLWPMFDAATQRRTTLLRGENSDLLSAAVAARMAERAPDMRSVCVANRGHVPFLDEAEALDAIRAHLEDTE